MPEPGPVPRPGADGSLGVSTIGRVASSCDRLEAAWRGWDRVGPRPRVEDVLPGPDARAPERARTLRDLIAVEAELRRRDGESPTAAEYLARFPDLTPAEAEALAGPTPAEGDPGAPTEPPSPAGPVGPVEEVPPGFGRYVPTRLLGSGAFGRVYLARDEELGRDVAVKVLRPHLIGSAEGVRAFLDEARLVASLSHPAIVRVWDFGREGDQVFLVMEYVPGGTLADLFRANPPGPTRLAGLVARVAEAAHHAHGALVHRDLKPSNILIGLDGEPLLSDFGLALREELQHLRAGEVAGTPAYMAPEQVRGESHRLDGRTDVWALGVILYQGLIGRPPFSGRAREEIYEEILGRDPRPPRQARDAVPRELERICLKCLSRRMTDRYQTAADLAEDLRSWLASDSPTVSQAPAPAPAPRREAVPGSVRDEAPARVIPKGLRAFDGDDAEFFLGLLPGPRDREGLPDSVRGWKARIERRDAPGAFSVGLLYGPSGSGKSSLVRAGLLPRLAGHVRPAVVEATPGGTEAGLLAALRRAVPDLPEGIGLVEASAAVRAGRFVPPGSKVLVVIDQFEQWLHRNPELRDAELVRALRQCDGAGLQALLLVRDEFWMAVTRLARALEVHLVEGENSSAVELFDAAHARRVLAEFGRAWDRFPGGSASGSVSVSASVSGSGRAEAEADRFVDLAVAGLAGPDGRIMPVRLALFAEMVRHRPWTPATWRGLGGVEGIGVTFLEETFGDRAAAPLHRLHARAAQGAFRALLPDPSSDLKGARRPEGTLREAAGYADRPDDFAELMRVIDDELRMVTPVDADGRDGASASGGPEPGEVCYQLTHDYLVPPLRQWLSKKKGETRRGRAELRLEAVTAHWRDREETRRLPSLFEWSGIVLRADRRGRSPDERRLMAAAARHHLGRLALAVALVAAGALGLRSNLRRARAQEVFSAALGGGVGRLESLLPEIKTHRDRLRPDLEGIEADGSAPDRKRAAAGLILFREWPTPARGAALRDWLRSAEPDEAVAIASALAAHPGLAGGEALREALLDAEADRGVRLRFAVALARLGPPGGGVGLPGIPESAKALTRALLAEDRRSAPAWLADLGPWARALVGPLGEVCRARDVGKGDPVARATAAEALVDLLTRPGHADPAALARLAAESQPDAGRIVLRALARPGGEGRDRAVAVLREILAGRPAGQAGIVEAGRQAAAAIALARLGDHRPMRDRLGFDPDPGTRARLIGQLAVSTLAPGPLLGRLRDGTPAERQALLMAWAEAPRGAVSVAVRAQITAAAADLHEADLDPGVHSAAALLLRRWDRDAFGLSAGRVARKGPPAGARWCLGPNGHTFAVFPGPLDFLVGSPPDDPDREPAERQARRKIERSIVAATEEVTLAQYHAWRCPCQHNDRAGPSPDGPVNGVSWFDAARYCNWLSDRDGLPRCYPEPIGPGMVLPAGSVDRLGYRLPTEAEWEYLCRAGTVTPFGFGPTDALLPRYGRTFIDRPTVTMPVGSLLPNAWGLFDLHGNVWEWCHDGLSVPGDKAIPPHADDLGDRPGRDETLAVGLDSGATVRRFTRGGAYDYSPSHARSSDRYVATISLRSASFGFRVVRTLPSP